MYKLLIVDDEELEREGMAEFIPWERYDVTLVGTAWNGMEGYQKIQKLQPDIIMTDIKMPVMDGLTLIHKTKEEYPDMEFIVLSGYGEYEFTSRAMEDGVRYYILKPCDEEKICGVLEKVKTVIREKRSAREILKKQEHTISKLMPHAREQVFMKMLLGKEQIPEEYELFVSEFQIENTLFHIFVIKSKEKTEYEEQLILMNEMCQKLGERQVLSTTIINDQICFLITNKTKTEIEKVIREMNDQTDDVISNEIYAALSESMELSDIRKGYRQTEELIRFCELEQYKKLLSYEEFKKERKLQVVDCEYFFHDIQNTNFILELYLVFCKMQHQNYTVAHKQKICQGILRILQGENKIFPKSIREDQQMFSYMVDEIIIKKIDDKELQQFWKVKKEIWLHLSSQNLSIKYLAREVLYMNEDYLGRFFHKFQQTKFSAYVLEQRIEVARRLFEYDLDMKVNEVVGMIGFPLDGQYFSRAFKKQVGVTPSEYRSKMVDL